MGSVGDCYDNALCESFFASLECELLDRRSFQTHAETRMAVFQYIEGWYNTHRRHSSIDYYAPTAFERRYTSSIQHVEPLTVHQIGSTPPSPVPFSLTTYRPPRPASDAQQLVKSNSRFVETSTVLDDSYLRLSRSADRDLPSFDGERRSPRDLHVERLVEAFRGKFSRGALMGDLDLPSRPHSQLMGYLP